MEISGGTNGVIIGTIYSTGAYNIYMRDLDIHGSSDAGMRYYTKSHDIVAERVNIHDTGEDGFGSHLAWGNGETYPGSGPSNDSTQVFKNLYFVNCVSEGNEKKVLTLQW